MFIESNDLNKEDIISRNKKYHDENKQYFNTTIKKKKFTKKNSFKDTDLLINELKDFSVKYELYDQKIMKNPKFVLSFDELISLIRFTIESQIKLNNYLKFEDIDNSKTFSKEFINELSNYIYSYEKVEKINPDSKNKKKLKSPPEKENININSNICRNKKPISIIINKSPSYWIDGKKTSIIENKKKEKQKVEKNGYSHIKNKSSNNFIQGSKSYYRNKGTSKLFSSDYNRMSEKYKKNENKKKEHLNRSVEKRHNSIFSNFSSNNNECTTKKKLNKSTEKRKSSKLIKNKNENKSLSIYTACENLKSSSFLVKNKSNLFTSTEQSEKRNIKKKNNNYSSNNNLNIDKTKEKKNIIYYNKNMMIGVKKYVITSNLPKPSNLANKLLQNGRKFITEFNGIKEEEKKKQYF